MLRPTAFPYSVGVLCQGASYPIHPYLYRYSETVGVDLLRPLSWIFAQRFVIRPLLCTPPTCTSYRMLQSCRRSHGGGQNPPPPSPRNATSLRICTATRSMHLAYACIIILCVYIVQDVRHFCSHYGRNPRALSR